MLNKKEEYKYSDYDDLDYFGKRYIENFFININDADYYKPTLVKSSFNNSYENYAIRGNRDKKLSVKQYLTKIMPHLTDLINGKKNNDNEQKIQLSMDINFICVTDKEKTRTFHEKSDDEDIRLGNDTSNIINKLYEYFLPNYQKEEQILRNGSNFVFESIHLKLKRGASYIEFPKWIANTKATINPKNTKNNKCVRYSITVALNHQEIGRNPQRILNIKPRIDKYNWKDINFPAGIKDWEKFERNNKDIALKIVFTSLNTKNFNLICKSKYNRKCKNQVVLLMIIDKDQEDTEEKWHSIALKSEPSDNG